MLLYRVKSRLIRMNTSKLQTVFFVPGERKPLYLIRTLSMTPSFSLLTGFDCNTFSQSKSVNHYLFPFVYIEIGIVCSRPFFVQKKSERGGCTRERWRPGRHKWQTEVDICSLSVLWLDKFVQRVLKQRPSGTSAFSLQLSSVFTL